MSDSQPALCACGCGQPVPIAKRTCHHHHMVVGQPMRYIKGHNKKGVAVASVHPWRKYNRQIPGNIPENAPADQ